MEKVDAGLIARRLPFNEERYAKYCVSTSQTLGYLERVEGLLNGSAPSTTTVDPGIRPQVNCLFLLVRCVPLAPYVRQTFQAIIEIRKSANNEET